MNRLAMMVLKNILAVPGLYVKLCHYAKNTDKYPEAGFCDTHRLDRLTENMEVVLTASSDKT